MPDIRKLKPLSEMIQVCQQCGKIDAYNGDGHSCADEITRRANREMSDD